MALDPSDRGDKQANVVQVCLMVAFLTLQILVATYVLVMTWPAAIESAESFPGSSGGSVSPNYRTLSLFNSTFITSIEGVYLFLVIAAGALGSAVTSAMGFATYVGNRQLRESWLAWYFIMFPIGIGFPLIVYFAIKGGLLNINAGSNALNPYGIVAIAALSGMFSKEIMDRLKKWAGEQFLTPASNTADRSDQVPTARNSEEPKVERPASPDRE